MDADDLDDGLAYDANLSDVEVVPVSDTEAPQVQESDEEAVENLKKRKKTGNFQEKKKMKMQMDVERKRTISQESSVDVITDYINDLVRKKNADLSALELAELYFHKTDFRSTAELEGERSLDNLSKFISSRFLNMLPSSTPGKKNKSKKNKKNKKKEEPVETNGDAEKERKFIAILSMSAIRACDVHRALRDIPGSSLKLINKNKIDVDLKLVKSTWSRVLCCTPGRLQKVLNSEDDSLKKDEIKIVILDNSYLDKKMQNIWNIAETTSALKELTAQGAKVYLY